MAVLRPGRVDAPSHRVSKRLGGHLKFVLVHNIPRAIGSYHLWIFAAFLQHLNQFPDFLHAFYGVFIEP